MNESYVTYLQAASIGLNLLFKLHALDYTCLLSLVMYAILHMQAVPL